MRNHLAFKFLAVLVCSLALLSCLGCTVSLVVLAGMGINDNYTVEDAYRSETAGLHQWTAHSIAQRYASSALGGCPEELVDAYYGSTVFSSSYRTDRVFYTIENEKGSLLETTVPDRDDLTAYPVKVPSVRYIHLISVESPVHSISVPKYAFDDRLSEEAASEAAAEPTEQLHTNVFSTTDEDGGLVVYSYVRENSPRYVVTLYLAPNALTSDQGWNILRLAWNYRIWMIALLGLSMLVLAISAVYLCTAAGRDKDNRIVCPVGLNRMPIDLYFLITGSVGVVAVLLMLRAGEYLITRDFRVILACMLYAGYGACLVFVGFCYCFAAQIKMPEHFILHNSLCGQLFGLTFRVVKWLWKNLPSCLYKTCKGLYGLSVRVIRAGLVLLKWLKAQLSRPISFVWKRIRSLVRLLPLIWQWMLVGGVMLFVLVLTLALRYEFWFAFTVAGCFVLVLYGAWAFGTLLEAAQRMRSGSLENKVDDKYMVGGYRDFADALNGLADVAVVAAQAQLKSERMKTELITNVSHDIKTPMTSIINYVDLLSQPHTPEQEAQYLEVLNRQSQRMKKLIDDLMEMSKASSGNMTVEIMDIDGAEAVNQALGEFSDKLDKADLLPVFHHPEEPIILKADGRLLWRAMSNVLSNAVKYALPGTRLYIDLAVLDGKAVISFKNISRDPLNISADELLERFVRGDASRNTEGSGLGLNIAKSLMELQHGKLYLLVDGDLFKATLVFPLA